MTRSDVSVVIPVYNGAKYVAAAVESALAQTWAPAQVIVVDDGSVDGTAAVLAGFADAISLVSVRNGGVARARNVGAQRANRRWLAFLDADDVWLPHRLERQLTELGDRDVALAYCGLLVVDEGLDPVRRMGVPALGAALAHTVLLEPPPVSVAQAALVDRVAFWAVGGFEESMSTSEDADLVVRLLTSYPAHALDEDLILYRLHPAQASKNVHAVERGWYRLHARTFGQGVLPAELECQYGRARANLHSSVAAELAARGQWSDALRHGIRALAADPSRTLELSRRRLRRVLGRGR